MYTYSSHINLVVYGKIENVSSTVREQNWIQQELLEFSIEFLNQIHTGFIMLIILKGR